MIGGLRNPLRASSELEPQIRFIPSGSYNTVSVQSSGSYNTDSVQSSGSYNTDSVQSSESYNTVSVQLFGVTIQFRFNLPEVTMKKMKKLKNLKHNLAKSENFFTVKLDKEQLNDIVKSQLEKFEVDAVTVKNEIIREFAEKLKCILQIFHLKGGDI